MKGHAKTKSGEEIFGQTLDGHILSKKKQEVLVKIHLQNNTRMLS
jgi:hypothetical protein